ncbi:prealbumin-like fold domain-containing protein [Luteimicrobium sp. DT211]|uniref:DUF7927 domain-containing protein n=1 Tax=Luteimicrobium sp. DT211 TaxID=3393412 RepID=UPI003CF0553F
MAVVAGVTVMLLTVAPLAGAADGPTSSGTATLTPSPDAPADAASPTASPTPTWTATPTPSPSPSTTPTPSATRSPSPTATPSPPASIASPDALAVTPFVVPVPPANSSVITVKVGSARTSLTAVGNLAGVTLGLFTTPGATTPVAGFGTCVSDADGDCSFTVPNTQTGGTNRDRVFYVKQVAGAAAIPAGYYTNPTLGTGTTVAADTYVFPTSSQLRAATIYRSTADFMISTGTTNNEASGGIWQQSLDNPTFPAQCGITVGLVLDLSNSVTDAQLVSLKAAANQMVSALTGTPSRVGTFTFATSAPASTGDTLAPTTVSTAAGASAVTAKINGYAKPGGNAGGTNWDRGLYQVAQSPSRFDVAVVITDGNPTFYGNGEGPGNRTRFREVENGIFSANAIKAQGTKVIALGVGDGVGSTGSGYNLRSISGPTLNTDYYQTADYAAAGDQLRQLALGSCLGSVTVVKEVVPSTAAPGTTTGAVPQGGWTFTGAGSTGVAVDAPTARVTADGTGAANFPLTFSGGTTTGPVTFTETQQAGYTLQQVGGANAVCTRVDTGVGVTVTNAGATGFSVPASSTYPVSCVVYNRAPVPLASVVLHKRWVVNGTTYADGAQPPELVASGSIDGTLAPWEQTQTGFRQGDTVSVDESTDLTAVPLCTLTSARLTGANGATVDLALPQAETLAAGTNSYTITNTVTCETRLELTKTVQGGSADPDDWTLTATAPASAAAGPTGTDGVNGLVTAGATYALSESAPHPEYQQFVDPNAVLVPGSTGSWNCQEVEADGTTVIPGFQDGLNGGVTVPFGSYVRCDAVNRTATLTLEKLVENTHGGTAVPGDWSLTATPVGTFPAGLPAHTVTSSTPGATFNVRPGVSYNLTESGGPPGYVLDSIQCVVIPGPKVTSVTLGALDDATCAFTNLDQPAQLTLVKTVTNDDGGAAVPTDWTLAADGPTPITGATGSDAVTGATVDAGTYTLSESGGPAGYSAGSWSCTAGTLTGASLVLGVGQSATCTLNNDDQPAQLTLVKTVTNDDGGTAAPTAWTLAADGPTTISGATGSDAVTGATVDAGTYTLSESGGPAGYTAGDWSCTGGTLTGSSLTLANGGSATCTLDNDDQPAHLTLVKTVTNDDGGTAVPTQWTLTAGGPTPISGVTGSAAVTGATVDAGTYTLSESGGPAGYTAGSWSCTAGTLTGATLVLGVGQSATCTLDNDDQPAHLTLVKVVDAGATGSGRTPSDWTLTATPSAIPGQGTVSGTGDPTTPGGVDAVSVSAGDYELTEDGPGGFDPGDWVCQGGVLGGDGSTVTVPNGGNVVCTITNTAVSPTLTLVKVVENTHGGISTVSDWTLTADGPTPVSGATGEDAVTGAPVQVGTYDLSETGPVGYVASDWVCTGGTTSTATTVTLAEGDDVTCTVTNSDAAAHLTLVKQVDNLHGGTAVPTDWTLGADGPTPISGATGTADVTGAVVHAGAYDLSESGGPTGYEAGSWSCDGGLVVGAVVTVPTGADVTCTLTNTDLAAALTLVKVVENTHGGDAVATDWTLAADGPTPVTGTSGSDAVTAVAVDAGSYGLTESGGPSGYGASSWVCTNAGSGGSTTVTDASVVLPNGADVTCTITNSDQPAHLTLVKKVVGEDAAAPTAWTLSADGPTPVSGVTGSDAVTGAAVTAGDYELAESDGPAGYDAGPWLCTGGTLDGSTLTVPLGGEATCTITNTLPGSFDVSKSSDPATGSTVVPGQTITYTVTARKLAGTDPRNVVVDDDLSDVVSHATLVEGSVHASAGTAAVRGGDLLRWTVPTLQGTQTVTYQVVVDQDAVDVRLTNVITSAGSQTCVPASSVAAERAFTESAFTASAFAVSAAATPVQPLAATGDEHCSTTHTTGPAPTPTPTTDPTATPSSPATGTQPPGAEPPLAVTGATVLAVGGVALALLCVGAALVLMVRRRRGPTA